MNDLKIAGWKRTVAIATVIIVGLIIAYITLEQLKPAQRKIDETTQKLELYKDSSTVSNVAALDRLYNEYNTAHYERENYNPILGFGLGIIAIGVMLTLVGVAFYSLTEFNFTKMLIAGEDGKLDTVEDRGIAVKLLGILIFSITALMTVCLYLIMVK